MAAAAAVTVPARRSIVRSAPILTSLCAKGGPPSPARVRTGVKHSLSGAASAENTQTCVCRGPRDAVHRAGAYSASAQDYSDSDRQSGPWPSRLAAVARGHGRSGSCSRNEDDGGCGRGRRGTWRHCARGEPDCAGDLCVLRVLAWHGQRDVDEDPRQARAHEALGGRTYVVVSDDASMTTRRGRSCVTPPGGRAKREWFTRQASVALDAVLRSHLRHGDRSSRASTARRWPAVPRDGKALVVYNYAGAITRRLARDFGGKVVLHLGNEVFRTWRPREIRRVIERTHVTVAGERLPRRHDRGATRFRPDNLHVLRNGVDAQHFRPVSRPRGDACTILFVGNVVPHKGAHHLVAAAHEIARRTKDFRVHIVGSAGLRPADASVAVRGAAEAGGGSAGRPRARSRPFVERRSLPAVYADADVFCMPVEWQEPLVRSSRRRWRRAYRWSRRAVAASRNTSATRASTSRPQDTASLADALHALVMDPGRASAPWCAPCARGPRR